MPHRAHVRIPEDSSKKQIRTANLIKTEKKDKNIRWRNV